MVEPHADPFRHSGSGEKMPAVLGPGGLAAAAPGRRPLPWSSILVALATLLLVAGVGYGLSRLLVRPVVADLRTEGARAAIQESTLGQVYLSPWFWGLIVGTVILERWLPADRRQPVLSVGFFQDAVYFLLIGFLRVTLLAGFVAVLKTVYDRYLTALTIESIRSWSPVARAGLAILLADFLAWFHHYVRHKVPLFWRFHTIHHAQRELNLFTDVRYHPVEYVVTQTILFVPVLMCQAAFPVAVTYALLHQWYTKFYHANIRTNLGPLRYVLVTPQSHRIHHSIEDRHLDRNFGVILSVWDRLFGTQHPDSTVYPATGITDPRFPHERSVDRLGLLRSPLAQLLYPFRGLASGRSLGQAGP